MSSSTKTHPSELSVVSLPIVVLDPPAGTPSGPKRTWSLALVTERIRSCTAGLSRVCPNGSSVAQGVVRHAAELTIEFVANQQPDALRKQQRGV